MSAIASSAALHEWRGLEMNIPTWRDQALLLEQQMQSVATAS